MVHALQPLLLPLLLLLLLTAAPSVAAAGMPAVGYNAKSGVRPWVDVYTPRSVYNATSSRGGTWELVFSDEFNVPGRDFSAGGDYLWTALELPDGVNAALEYYSVNMTSTKNESDGRGVFQIEVREEPNITFTVFNAYSRPPSFQEHSMYYRAGMVQSWNKFCFQGGMVEVKAQLPGAVSAASGNPDLSGNDRTRVKNNEYYPTWPGIWFLGNLGRALFTASTNRMWPWSFNECDATLQQSQRISACDSNPGHGLNKNQGRGAPEIDLLEGGGVAVSTSIQVAPGMPDAFRIIPPSQDNNIYCVYGGECKTPGANFPGIPTAVYAKRGHLSWYQGLRYAPNTVCAPDGTLMQTPSTVISNLKKGITDNTCKGVNTCPASHDGGSDVTNIDNTTRYWGVNAEGGCMPIINGYMGTYLCDPDNSNSKCAEPLHNANTKTNILPTFNYQMDAISANSGLPLRAYTGWMRYQLEWVLGADGYVRWMVDDVPIFEIPSKSLTEPPQDDNNSNPRKVMVEEPLYIIFNVALSTSWGARPPNPGKPCRGDGSDAKINKICDDFPMYLKIDYIRIWQDVSPGSTMAIGCDPATHPTKKWIEDHLEEYEDPKNKVIAVKGGAPCFTNNDCTVSTIAAAVIVTGKCQNNKCVCTQNTWGGPRCTTPLSDAGSGSTRGFGPSIAVAAVFGALGIIVICIVVYRLIRKRNRQLLEQSYTTKDSHTNELHDLADAPSQSQSHSNAAV
ncbi:hypothetical protein PINS_up012905 [Pythium insidiosum]|nr:hypothetical protein PINS_up012905 [Pythium insidiosum]